MQSYFVVFDIEPRRARTRILKTTKKFPCRIIDTVDLIEPFLLDAVYGKLHTIGEISSTCLEFNFNLRDWIYRFYKFERLEVSGRKLYSFKEETSISFVAGKGTIHPAHVSRAQRRDDISALKIGAKAAREGAVFRAVGDDAVKR